MTDPNSPHYQFDPASVGWLHRRARNKEQVLDADLIRIVEANPDLVPDVVLRSLIVRGLKNELKAKRGRKRTTARMLKEAYIAASYEHRLAWLQARATKRKANGIRKLPVEHAPAELACELTGHELHMAPESVRNLVSSLNNRK